MEYSEIASREWSNIIYILILIVLLIMGFSRKELPMKKFFEYAGLWIAFALIALVLYSYRFEIIEVKNRILSDLFPSKAINKNHQELTLSVAQDGHYYLDIKIKNQLVRFMIDTGASDIVLNLEEAKRVGIDVKKLRFDRTYQTANGKSFGAMVVLDEIAVADVIFSKVSASVNSAEMGTSLLGMRFLRQFKKYEFYQDRLVLTI